MPRKTQEESQETRKNILECAKRLFSKRGYERTSLSDIAKYSGVSRGAIYWHFESKEDLLVNLVEYVDVKTEGVRYFFESASPLEQDPLSKLKAFVLCIFSEELSEFFNSSFVNMLIGISNGFSGNEDARAKLAELDKQRMDQLSKIIMNCVAKGQLPKNLNIRAATEHLAVFMSGIFFQTRMKNTDALKKYYSQIVDMEIEQLKLLVQS